MKLVIERKVVEYTSYRPIFRASITTERNHAYIDTDLWDDSRVDWRYVEATISILLLELGKQALKGK